MFINRTPRELAALQKTDTGATGYRGIHILHEFIKNRARKVYCLLRGKKDLPAETRLKAQLFYYFDQSYAELFGKRIFILEGNVTRAGTLEQIKSLPELQFIQISTMSTIRSGINGEVDESGAAGS